MSFEGAISLTQIKPPAVTKRNLKEISHPDLELLKGKKVLLFDTPPSDENFANKIMEKTLVDTYGVILSYRDNTKMLDEQEEIIKFITDNQIQALLIHIPVHNSIAAPKFVDFIRRLLVINNLKHHITLLQGGTYTNKKAFDEAFPNEEISYADRSSIPGITRTLAHLFKKYPLEASE